jgi:hypothetical protein
VGFSSLCIRDTETEIKEGRGERERQKEREREREKERQSSCPLHLTRELCSEVKATCKFKLSPSPGSKLKR